MILAGSVFAFLAEHRRVLFSPQAFTDMYALVVRAVVEQTGVLTGRTRWALDSMVLLDAVATQDKSSS